jgi:hypothetical protein
MIAGLTAAALYRRKRGLDRTAVHLGIRFI